MSNSYQVIARPTPPDYRTVTLRIEVGGLGNTVEIAPRQARDLAVRLLQAAQECEDSTARLATS